MTVLHDRSSVTCRKDRRDSADSCLCGPLHDSGEEGEGRHPAGGGPVHGSEAGFGETDFVHMFAVVMAPVAIDNGRLSAYNPYR